MDTLEFRTLARQLVKNPFIYTNKIAGGRGKRRMAIRSWGNPWIVANKLEAAGAEDVKVYVAGNGGGTYIRATVDYKEPATTWERGCAIFSAHPWDTPEGIRRINVAVGDEEESWIDEDEARYERANRLVERLLVDGLIGARSRDELVTTIEAFLYDEEI